MAKFTITGATTYDLTDTATNKGAVEPTTPREGGFVLRNRIDFTTTTCPTATAGIANVLRLLKVPKRTVIRELRFHAIRGKTAPTHAWSSAASVSAASGTMNVGGVWYTDASQTAASVVTDTDALADHAITAGTGVAAGMPTLASSGDMTDYVAQSDTGAPALPFTFPYGGWITMGIENSTGSSASSVSAKMAGVLEVRCVCDYIPE